MPKVGWIIAFLFLWVCGSLASVTLLMEYPSYVSAIHWRTYPGLFLWPIFFLPICCLCLVRPTILVWRFLSSRIDNRYRALAICLLPIVITMIGMSGYEWFNGKPAVWEVAPAIAARPATANFPAIRPLPPALSHVGSFDGLALSIRSKGAEDDYISECRFSGENLPRYRAESCFCTPMRAIANGGTCDEVRRQWFGALATVIAVPSARSYTYYSSRLAFSAMTLIFITSFLIAVFMSCFNDEISTANPAEYEFARVCIQIQALLCCVWGVQRMYLNYELIKIFPRDAPSMLLSSAMSTILCLIIFFGVIYAYSLKLKIVMSFAENLLVPFVFVFSVVLGFFNRETTMSLLRVTFGIDATGPAILASITAMLFFCIIPLIYLLKRRLAAA